MKKVFLFCLVLFLCHSCKTGNNIYEQVESYRLHMQEKEAAYNFAPGQFNLDEDGLVEYLRGGGSLPDVNN